MNRTLVVFAAFSLWAGVAATPASAALLSLNTVSADVNEGTSFELTVGISGLDASLALSTFDVDLLFDPTIVSVGSVTFGDPILGDQLDFGLGALTFSTPVLGALNLFGLSFESPSVLNSLQADVFVLATIFFTADSAGFSALDLFVNALGDSDAAPISSTVTGSSVTVAPAPIPEPSTLLLVASGAALAIRRRLRKRRTTLE